MEGETFWSKPNLKILAPMVRVGRLPFRLLSEEYGADIVFSEELIDRKLIRCERVFNEKLNCVEYHNKKSCGRVEVVYRYQKRSVPTVLQIGTADAVYSLQAAKMMFQDYEGLDVNMGCPKGFSVRGRMGIALLKDPQRVKEVLTTLVRNISKPISCKIRIFPDDKKTIDLLKMIDGIGVDNITIHSRFPDERPRKDSAHPDRIKTLIHGLTTPVVYNGDIFKPEDIPRMQKLTGCSSVMIARGALYNVSLFSKELEKNTDPIAMKIIDLSEKFECGFLNAQYIVKRMHEDKKGKIYKRIIQVRNMDDLKEVFTPRMEEMAPPNKRQKIRKETDDEDKDEKIEKKENK